MEDARIWLIGLAILSILAMGIIAWVDVVPAPAVSMKAGAVAEPAISAPTTTSAWGDATPNFVAGEVPDEHEGGKSDGWGKLTVSDACSQEGIDLADAESRLGAYGLEMDPRQRIRELAELSGYKSSEVVDILLGREPGTGCDDPDCEPGADQGDGYEDHVCNDES